MTLFSEKAPIKRGLENRWPGICAAKAIKCLGNNSITLRIGNRRIKFDDRPASELKEAIRQYNKVSHDKICYAEVSAIVRNMGTRLGVNEIKFLGLENVDLARLTFLVHKFSGTLKELLLKGPGDNSRYRQELSEYYAFMNDAKTPEQRAFALLLNSYIMWEHDMKTWIHQNEVRVILKHMVEEAGLDDPVVKGMNITESGAASHQHDFGKLGVPHKDLHDRHLSKDRIDGSARYMSIWAYTC